MLIILSSFKNQDLHYFMIPIMTYLITLYLFQWQQASRCYTFLIYRWILSLFFFGAFIFCCWNHILQYNEISKPFIYLSSWGFTLCVVYSLVAAIVTTWYFQPAQLENIETTDNMPMILKVSTSSATT